MIDVLETTRLALVADSDLFAATGGVKDGMGTVTTPARIWHGQMPTEITDGWAQPEDVDASIFLTADGDSDFNAPDVSADITAICYAATHQAAAILAALVVSVLESLDREEVNGVFVVHFSQTSTPTPDTEVETLWRFCEVGLDTTMIE